MSQARIEALEARIKGLEAEITAAIIDRTPVVAAAKHLPAGSSKGGQFAPGSGSGGGSSAHGSSAHGSSAHGSTGIDRPTAGPPPPALAKRVAADHNLMTSYSLSSKKLYQAGKASDGTPVVEFATNKGMALTPRGTNQARWEVTSRYSKKEGQWRVHGKDGTPHPINDPGMSKELDRHAAGSRLQEIRRIKEMGTLDGDSVLAAANWDERAHKRGDGGLFSKTSGGGKVNPIKVNPFVKGARSGSKGGTGPAPAAARPGAKRIEEDTVPEKSPGGGTLKDFKRAGGPGVAVYSDGSVYDGKGWQPKAAKGRK